jgi:hypothetical protein
MAEKSTPNFIPPTPHHHVPVDEFIKALKGEPFKNINGLRREKGGDLINTDLLSDALINFKEDVDYVILQSATLVGKDIIAFKNKEQARYNVDIIIYNSVIPPITLQSVTTGEWQFFNSLINGALVFDTNSQCREIVFERSKCDALRIVRGSRCGNISIYDNSEIQNIILSRNAQCGSISVEFAKTEIVSVTGSAYAQSITILYSSICQSIAVVKSSASELIAIETESECGNIEVDSKSLVESILISRNAKCGDVSIKDESLTKGIWIEEKSQVGDIVIEGKSQTGNVSVRSSTCSSLSITDNYGSLELFNAKVPLIKIETSNIPELRWLAGTRGEFYVTQCEINNLNLKSTSLKDAQIVMTGNRVFISEMNEFTVGGQLLLTKIKELPTPFKWNPPIRQAISKLRPKEKSNPGLDIYVRKVALLQEMKREYNKEIVKLIERSDRPLWIVADSSLGKTEITGCDLTRFEFQYRDSKILDCFISGTRLPKEKIEIYNHNPKSRLDDVDYFEQKVSVYNQLKKIFDNQGNIVEATWYHSKAMDNQQNLLWSSFKLPNAKFWNRVGQFFEYLGFLLNKVSNNHGESWIKALVFTLICAFTFFAFSIWSIKYHFNRELLFTLQGWSFFLDFDFVGENIQKFPGFFLFTHKLEYLSEGLTLAPSKWHLLWDVLGRIMIGYGIYQFVSAFRRHGRR